MFDVKDIPAALSGDSLLEAIHKAKEKRRALAEGFLYEQTINMFMAEPGIGKSTISTQVAVELAAGLPVFGIFPCPRPLRVMYIQTERNIIELLERLEVINKILSINKENLYITDEYQRFNLLNTEQAKVFLECIIRDCPRADIIFIDPIYATVAGGLKEDVPAAAFTKAMSNLQKATGASLWYNHHTSRPQYGSDGKKIVKDDPMYGSQWLKAHVTGSMLITPTEHGVSLVRKKDNYRLLPDTILLDYDAETELCSVKIDELPALERVRNFLRIRDVDGKQFSFNDILTETKLCNRTLRMLLLHSSIKDRLFVVSNKKNKRLYTTHSLKTSCAVQPYTI